MPAARPRHRVGEVIAARRVVVVRKTSAIERQALQRDLRVARVLAEGGAVAQRLRQAHEEHEATSVSVEAALRAAGCEVRVVSGLRRRDAAHADLIVTVGGDGTFLRASHHVAGDARGDGPPMLGVNSAPLSSVGYFCAASASSFEAVLGRILAGEYRSRALWRMRVRLNGVPIADAALNDALFAHREPAETTRYTLEADGHCQRQKSSGLWIATAAGSTGAIRSAGGDIQDLDDQRVQFRVRELFPLSVGDEAPVIAGKVDVLRLRSHTTDGVLWIDGAHRRVPFGLGDLLEFRTDTAPLPWLEPEGSADRRAHLRRQSERVLLAAR